ncbi:MAG: hypothetical protein FJZ43_01365 [Candidatus Staskawiczbacteria bacterium]|nr:hypothetical protein [Candidatus Staskawiczbacteria bacterium]
MDKIESALKWILPILKKHKVPFQISGGFAAHIYGSKRPVNDIDIDIPEDKIDVLVPDVKEYIVYGPAQHKNNRWDLKLITLEYYGQEIDIGGAYNVKIFDDNESIWKSFPAKLEEVEFHNVYGFNLPVVEPRYLADYKKLLSGDHQKVDVKAVENYILNKK